MIPHRILLTVDEIAMRLDELAAEITAAYAGRPFTAVAILNGGLVFAAGLLRRIPFPVRMECLSASSYTGCKSRGVVTLSPELPSLEGQHVLLLDDILDTGLTLHAIRRRLLEECRPASLRVAVLLQKRKPRVHEGGADHVGFEIDDEFVIGYGLDHEERYRDLPDVRVMDAENF